MLVQCLLAVIVFPPETPQIGQWLRCLNVFSKIFTAFSPRNPYSDPPGVGLHPGRGVGKSERSLLHFIIPVGGVSTFPNQGGAFWDTPSEENVFSPLWMGQFDAVQSAAFVFQMEPTQRVGPAAHFFGWRGPCSSCGGVPAGPFFPPVRLRTPVRPGSQVETKFLQNAKPVKGEKFSAQNTEIFFPKVLW